MISLNKLRLIAQGRIRASGPNWEFGFLSSVNDVIQDLIRETVITVEGIDEDNPPANINLDAKYFNVFADGIEYYMQKNFSWARVNKEFSDAVYRRSLAEAQSSAIIEEDLPVRLDYEDQT